MAAANKDPSFAGVFTLLNAGSPSVYADIDRLKAEKVGLTPTDVFDTLQVYLGSQYVNDFNFLGRTYEVIAQADGRFRRDRQDLMGLKARNASGEMVPIGTVAQLQDTTIPYRVPRYNLYPAAEVQGVAAPGVATGTALHRMEELAAQVLPPGIGYEWTEIAYQQEQKGTPTMLVFGAAALFVFLVLAANYESWKLPLSVVLIVPMCLLASVTGLLFRGMPIDILAQIGFVVLVGLAAKNAILIVEFARQAQEAGSSARGGSGQCGAAAAAADPDDVACLHSRRRAAGGRDWRRGRDAAIPGHRRLRRHARRHRLRPDLHAGVLHADAADRLCPQPSVVEFAGAARSGWRRRSRRGCGNSAASRSLERWHLEWKGPDCQGPNRCIGEPRARNACRSSVR